MPKRRFVRGCGIGCAGLLALAIIAAVVLLIWKPWAPEVEVVDPSAGGTRVTEDGLLGNYYPAAGGGKAPTVLVLGGSEGGLSGGVDRTAKTLSGEGFSAMALSYWGAPGQNPHMENLPLETFDTALAWLKRQPGVDANRIAVLGVSKGGEAAVLMGSRSPDLKATVGYVPSNVVWQGFSQAAPWRMLTTSNSTWSQGGQPLPFLPYTDDYRGGDRVNLYRLSLDQNLASHPQAVIPVERARGPMLLVCGEVDSMWPSCDMSRSVKERSTQKGGPEVTVLTYPQAGHMLFGPPTATDSEFYGRLGALGGTPETNNAAAADSWPKVLAFLKSSLRAS